MAGGSELDRRLLPVWKKRLGEFSNVTVISGDVMKLDLRQVIQEQFGDKPVCLCANLPYYITSPVIMKVLEENAGTVKAFDALRIAEECGSVKAVNVVLLGAASKDLPFDESAWIKVIEENVKPKFVELNKKAFEMGRNA